MVETQIFHYLRDCYRADNGRIAFLDLFNKNVTHRIFVKEHDELLCGLLDAVPLDAESAEEVRERAWMYRKEMEFVFCSLLIIGKAGTEDETSKFLSAPLLLHDAEIHETEGVLFGQINRQARRINRPLLDCLPLTGEPVNFEEQLVTRMDQDKLDATSIANLSGYLEREVTGLDCSMMDTWPQLLTGQEVRRTINKLRRSSNPAMKVLPVGFFALVRKSRGALGVINELDDLGKVKQPYSGPLATQLGHPQTGARRENPRLSRVPAVLSKTQTRILDHAANDPVTLVIGPPGTGKSFTIAAVATDHLARGETVLICSRMNHAVDVVGQKIQAMTGISDCVVRGGRKHYLRELKNRLSNLVAGIRSTRGSENRKLKLLLELDELDKEIKLQEKEVERLSKREIKWGAILADQRGGFHRTIKHKLVRAFAKRYRPLWEWLDDLERNLHRRIGRSADLIRVLNELRISKALDHHRKQIKSFLKGLKARTGGRQEEFFAQTDFDVILETFPIWLVNLNNLHDVLPNQVELFDLVIIDEASQCDMAACLPALQRSKRLLVLGDPHQLKHLSFLSRDRQRALAEKHQIRPELQERFDYRHLSFLDLINDTLLRQDDVIFLNEHFRSEPAIIQFSNQKFYSNALRIMTEKPGTSRSQALKLIHGPGERNDEGENEKEAVRLVERVLQRVRQDQYLPRNLAPTIGILSPFRRQVDLITRILLEKLDHETMERHQLLIGTAHTFQGEERDLVYLSMAMDPSFNSASLRFVEKPNVFNVAVTRARSYQEIHTSLQTGDLPPQSLVRSYFEHVNAPQNMRPNEVPNRDVRAHDIFLEEVARGFAELGCKTLSQYTVAGFVMDLLIVRDDKALAIDLIGYPGDFQDFVPLERYRVFARAGMAIFALPYAKWLTHRQECVAAALALLSGAKANAQKIN